MPRRIRELKAQIAREGFAYLPKRGGGLLAGKEGVQRLFWGSRATAALMLSVTLAQLPTAALLGLVGLA